MGCEGLSVLLGLKLIKEVGTLLGLVELFSIFIKRRKTLLDQKKHNFDLGLKFMLQGDKTLGEGFSLNSQTRGE